MLVYQRVQRYALESLESRDDNLPSTSCTAVTPHARASHRQWTALGAKASPGASKEFKGPEIIHPRAMPCAGCCGHILGPEVWRISTVK